MDSVNYLSELDIALSKSRRVLLLLVALVGIAISVWILTISRGIVFVIFNGLVGVLFFGVCGVVAIKKLLQTKPGLTINTQGVRDQSGLTSSVWIDWKNVKAVQPSTVAGQKYVCLILHDASAYTHRGNALQRWMVRMNIKLVGTPVNISDNTLMIAFDELLAALQKYHRQSQRGKQHG